MKSENIVSNLLSVLLLALSVFLTLGTEFIFHACDPMADGHFMSCHEAQHAVTGAGVVLIIFYILSLIVKERKVRSAFITSGIPVTILAMLIPGRLMHMCMSNTMRCHAVMEPSVLAVGCVILVVSVVALVVNLRKKGQDVDF